MKLTVIGATGGIGKELVSQAIAAGHTVTAVSRRKTSFRDGVRAFAIDLAAARAADLSEPIAGADAVLSALGPRGKADIGVAARGTETLIESMNAAQVKRLVAVSAAPVGTVPSPGRPLPSRFDPGDGFLMRHLLSPMTKLFLRHQYADLALMEDHLRASGLAWTAVRPPRLQSGPRSQAYRIALDQNVRGGLAISRADVADLMLKALVRPDMIGRTVGIAY